MQTEAAEEKAKVKELAAQKQAKNRENIKGLNRKINIVESEISVAEEAIAKGNDQLSKLFEKSSLKKDLLQQAKSKILMGVKHKAALLDELNVLEK